MMKRLRLVKVVVQPYFMVDDGDTLTEMVPEPLSVPAAEWPTYPTTQFVAAVESLEAELRAPNAAQGDE